MTERNLLASAVRRPGARASGSLSVLPPVALLQAAEASAMDLRLVMREHRNGNVLVISFCQGRPGMVFSPGDGRSLGELLLAAGLIDRETLARQFEARVQLRSGSLQRLLLERAELDAEHIQRFFDFQARVRLLDALVWEEGSFEIEQLTGTQDVPLRVELPNLAALALRARARVETRRLLRERIPGAPEDLLVRRRRGAQPPSNSLARSIWNTLGAPLLFPQIVARLLVDDDLVLEQVAGLAEDGRLVLQPRAALASRTPGSAAVSPLHVELLQEVVQRRATGGGAARSSVLWVVVVAEAPAVAVDLARRLGGAAAGDPPESGPLPVAFASATARVTSELRLSFLALRPGVLSPAALSGVMTRCDAICLLRTTDTESELGSLLGQVDRLASRAGRPPLLVGLDIGARLRSWGDRVDAVVGLPHGDTSDSRWLVERLIEGLFAAARATS